MQETFDKQLLPGRLTQLCPGGELLSFFRPQSPHLKTVEFAYLMSPSSLRLMWFCGEAGVVPWTRADMMKGPWGSVSAHKIMRGGVGEFPGRGKGELWLRQTGLPWRVQTEITSFCLWLSPLLGKDLSTCLYSGLCLVLWILRGKAPSCPQDTAGLGSIAALLRYNSSPYNPLV